MDSLKRPPFGSPFSRASVCRLFADLPLETVDGIPILSELVRWALSLNEGDLLIAAPPRGFGNVGWKFASYIDQVNAIVGAVHHPWAFFESDVFHGCMGAVGPGGALVLPDEAVPLVRPGESLCLKAEERTESFTLVSTSPRAESTEGLFRFPRFFVEARYKVPLAPDLRVTLPEEALWALAISPGDRLAGESSFAQVEVGPPSQGPGRGKSIELELEPGGALRLPESMRILLKGKPQGNALLEISVSKQPAFRITQWVDLDME